MTLVVINVDCLNTWGKFGHGGNDCVGGFVARHMHLQHIWLAHCHLTEEKVGWFFSGTFDHFPPIESVTIRHTFQPLLGPEIVESLTTFLGMNFPLKTLILKHVNLGVGGAVIKLSSALKLVGL